MEDVRKDMIGKKYTHNGGAVEVAYLDADESLVIVTSDEISFYPVPVAELTPLKKAKGRRK